MQNQENPNFSERFSSLLAKHKIQFFLYITLTFLVILAFFKTLNAYCVFQNCTISDKIILRLNPFDNLKSVKFKLSAYTAQTYMPRLQHVASYWSH
jgi:hypothetical protein